MPCSVISHPQILLTLGWVASTALWGLVLWAGMDSGHVQYRYNAAFAAQYAALAPIAASVAIAWTIYAVHNGHSGEFEHRCYEDGLVVGELSNDTASISLIPVGLLNI